MKLLDSFAWHVIWSPVQSDYLLFKDKPALWQCPHPAPWLHVTCRIHTIKMSTFKANIIIQVKQTLFFMCLPKDSLCLSCKVPLLCWTAIRTDCFLALFWPICVCAHCILVYVARIQLICILNKLSVIHLNFQSLAVDVWCAYRSCCLFVFVLYVPLLHDKFPSEVNKVNLNP